jgi:putative ABC transport system permease protein
MQRLLVDRLALTSATRFGLGTQDFELRAVLETEPDGAAAASRSARAPSCGWTALAGSGLIGSPARCSTRNTASPCRQRRPRALQAEAEGLFADTGMRWRDARNGAPGVQEFVDRIGAFLVLVGLAGLAVGGSACRRPCAPISTARSPPSRRSRRWGPRRARSSPSISRRSGLLTLVGIGIGLRLGARLPLALAPIIEARCRCPSPFRSTPPAGRGRALRPADRADLHALAAGPDRTGARRRALPRCGGPARALPRRAT